MMKEWGQIPVEIVFSIGGVNYLKAYWYWA